MADVFSMAGGAGSGAVQGYTGAKASSKAARDMQRANEAAKKAALEEEEKAYGLEKEKLDPWEQFGDKSRFSFQDLLGDNGPEARDAALKSLQESTGYKARILATDRGSNARGQYFSGRAGLALQDAASKEYDNEYTRRYGLAKDAYGITTDSMNKGGSYYRNRRDILNDSLLRGGQIQAGKWQGIKEASYRGNQTAAAGFGGGGGSSYGGKKKNEDESDSYGVMMRDQN